jgi:phosphoserine phosphatase RsbU/P
VRFRTALLIGIVALVSLMLWGSLIAVTRVLDVAAHARLKQDLEQSLRIAAEVQSSRHRALDSEARVVAEEPRLRAAMAAEEITHETLFSVAFEMQKAVGSDLFLLTDSRGTLLVDAAEPEAEGFELGQHPVIAGALRGGRAGSVWTRERAVYLVEARRVTLGEQVLGVLLVGKLLDAPFLEAVRAQTGGVVALEVDGQLVGSAWPPGAPGGRAAGLPEVLRRSPGDATGFPVTVVDARFLAARLAIPGYSGERRLRYVVLQSLDDALAPAARLERLLVLGALLVLGIAVLLASVLSSYLSQPLRALVNFTNRIAAGELDARADARGTLEVRALARAMNVMVSEVAASRRALVAKERLEQELEIADRIQTSILPRELGVQGLEIEARMVTATEVGGDYYDVIPVSGGAWLGIGDVAGHGLTAGLVMLMIQSGVSGLVRARPDAPPSELVNILNRVIHDNLRHRLTQDEHVTFCLVRYKADGRLSFAGAHEQILVWRSSTGRCETLETPGTWLGPVEAIEHVTRDSEATLDPGDVMLLYTDGLTEACQGGELLGEARLMEALERVAREPVQYIADHLIRTVDEWMDAQMDDITFMVVRYLGSGGEVGAIDPEPPLTPQ